MTVADCAPVFSTNEPAGAGVHFVVLTCASPRNVPAAQVAMPVDRVPSSRPPVPPDPSGIALHVVLRGASWYSPTGHGVGSVASSFATNVPAGAGTHALPSK